MQLDIDKEVALLQRMTVGQLRERFEETWGEPTKTRDKQWLLKRIAWKMQANIEGDISERARRRAAELARGTDIRTTAPKATKPVTNPVADTVTGFVEPGEDSRLPPPRSVIERVYKGQKILVLVLETGFEYDGAIYKTLSGGNMDRPALKQLLADIEAGKVNCVVVYKVDRLSCSLMDFAKMLEVFERNQIAFVSVTQQFNTTNSMGRLMLNVLLSFAQFEREIISERTRDKMAAARRKGKWSGGMPLLGYDIDPQGGNVTLANAITKLADTEANGGAGITFNASSPGRATVTVNSEDEISFAISDAAGRNVMSGKLSNYRGSGATAVSSSMQRTLRVLLTCRDSN